MLHAATVAIDANLNTPTSTKIQNRSQDHQEDQQDVRPEPYKAICKSSRPSQGTNRSTCHAAEAIDDVDNERVHLR